MAIDGDRGARVDQARGLMLACLLAGLAGMVDAIGFLRLGHLFVSYMSGNSTQFAVALGRGRVTEAGSILWLIALFVAGAAGGQMIAHFSGRWHLTCVLAMVAVLLAAAAVFGTAPEPMVVAMGALNASMHRAGKVAVSLTFVTGTLVKFGQGLGDFLTRRGAGWAWMEQAMPMGGVDRRRGCRRRWVCADGGRRDLASRGRRLPADPLVGRYPGAGIVGAATQEARRARSSLPSSFWPISTNRLRLGPGPGLSSSVNRPPMR